MKLLLIASLALAAAFAHSAEAQRPGAQGPNPRRQALERELNERTAAVLRRRLGLNDSQMARLQATNRQFEEQRRSLFERERQTRVELRREVLAEDQASQNRIAELLDQTLQLERQRLDLIQEEQRELAKFLSPIQRAKLLGFQAELRRRTQDMRMRPPRP
jgi:protein CpxP